MQAVAKIVLILGVVSITLGEFSSRVFPGVACGARASVLDVLRLTERDNRSSRKESLRLLQNLFSTGVIISLGKPKYV